jgi:hypothetical protein
VAFKDRQTQLFGRGRDREALVTRARTSKGLTAVVARPQAGKTWLLQEVGRCLTLDAAPPVLVGYAERLGPAQDLLLRAVADLYDRWLGEANALDRARRAWGQEKEKRFGRTATVIAKLLKEATPTALKPIAVLAEEAIGGLLRAKQEMKSGGLSLPKLDYDVVRDLVGAVADLSRQRIVLILDAFEQADDVRSEARTIAAILRHLNDWPDVHLIVGSRPDDPAEALIQEWRSASEAVRIERLDRLDLDDASETAGLLAFLRQALPATAAVDDATLLRDIDQHAGVIGRWFEAAEQGNLTDLAQLAQVAEDARAYRYLEFAAAFPKLAEDDLALAVRLALLPMTADAALWPRLAATVLAGARETRLDALVAARVLEQSDPPGYGHAKRCEAAVAWLAANRRLTVRGQAESMILAFAEEVRTVEPAVAVPAAALRAVAAVAGSTRLRDPAQALAAAAAALFGEQVDPALLSATVPPACVPLLAMGLVNTRNYAESAGDTRRDAMLDQLRGLAQAYPDQPAVIQSLAKSLFNTRNAAQEEGDTARRDALLDELRRLAAAYPDDAVVREEFAKGLFNTLNAALHEEIGKGSLNTSSGAEAKGDRARADRLLGDLRALAEGAPADAAVRARLAEGLFNTLYAAEHAGDRARGTALLEVLRKLAADYPSDTVVGKELARARALLEARAPARR